MQFKALIALIPLLATASAFFIPDEYQHDGFFTVDFDADGKPTFTEHDLAALVGRSAVEQKRDATSPSAKFAAAAKLERRDSWGSTGRLFPNHDDYNACTNEMKVWLNNGNTLPGHSKGWIRRNQAILMLCNYSGNAQGGFAWEVDNFNGLMDGVYGAWKTGWNHLSGPNKSWWRDIDGATDFCAV